MLNTWLFPDTTLELAGLLLVVLIAGIVRGAIGFGLSALVVASTGFWLPPVPVICVVVLLETAASLQLYSQTKKSINKPILWRITLSGAVSCIIGVTLLSTINEQLLTVFITVYLGTISLLTLCRFTLKKDINTTHYTVVGLFAGLANGLAGLGGLFIAFFMNATQTNVGQLRATISAYFLYSEFVFIAAALYRDLYTPQILATALLCLLPLWVGTRLGNHCFNYLSEEQLKRGVLITLLTLSTVGIIKTLVD